MNKSILSTLFFVCFTFSLSAQVNVIENVILPWDTLKAPLKGKASFKKYRQVGNKLLAEADSRLSYIAKYKYSSTDISAFTSTTLKYISDDNGKTWRLAVDSNDISTKNISHIAQFNKLYYFRVDDTAYYRRFVSSNGTSSSGIRYYNQALKRSENLGLTYKTVDSSEVSEGFHSASITNKLDYIEPQLFDFDSVIFKRHISTTVSGNTPSVNNKTYSYFFSTDTGSTWKPMQMGYSFSDHTVNLPFTTDYAANSFFAFRINSGSINIYKYPILDSPFIIGDDALLTKNYSIVEHNAVTYIYISDQDKIKLIRSNATLEGILPFDISLKLQKESAVFIDNDKKTLYLTTHTGIYRSEDPLFRTFKKIHQGRVSTVFNPLAFSVLPTGIYMNDVDGSLLRSTNKGDTWEKISDGNTYQKTFNTDNFFVTFDSTVVFNELDNKDVLYQTSDFRNIFPANNFNFSGIDFSTLKNINLADKDLSGYPFYFGEKVGSTYRLGSYVSTDSGRSWSIKPIPIDNNVLIYKQKFKDSKSSVADVYKLFIEDNKIIVITNKGEIFISEDNAITWLKTFAIPNFLLFEVSKHGKTIVISGDFYNSGIVSVTYMTTDYGITVRKVLNMPVFIGSFYMHHAISGKYLYIGNGGAMTWYSHLMSWKLKTTLIPLRIHVDSLYKYANVSDSDFGILRGQFLRDVNNNCQKDTLDNGIAEKVLRIDPYGYSVISDKNGRFAIALPPNTYIVSTQNIRYNNACQDTVFSNIKLVIKQTLDTNFLFKPIPNVYDATINLTAETPARPGFDLAFNVNTSNIGTSKIDSGVVTLRIPTQFATFISATQGGTYQNGQITWNIKNLQVDEKRAFRVALKVIPTTPLSTILSFSSKITVLNQKDTVPQNNEDIVNLTVRGSFDPNDKTVMPEGKISFFTNELDYLIRFQNTGTDTAFKVVVVDTLPANLDVFTMKIVSASHPYTVSLNKNIVTFTFENILLVDSFKNEKLSHGFVRFKVSPKQGVKVGDNISNKAAIYFDFNKPIITNIAKSELIKPSVSLTKTVEICKGEKYNGIVINADMTVLDTVKTSLLLDTIFTVSLKTLPTYTISRDTTLKGNLFEGVVVKNGDIIAKRFKTKIGGCDSIINYTITKINPTEELPSIFSSINISPNPANDYLSISYELKQSVWVEINTYNAIGQKVKTLQNKAPNTEGVHQLQADVKDLQSGTYQLEFRTESGVVYRQFVKM
jgi:hypothetical protein